MNAITHTPSEFKITSRNPKFDFVDVPKVWMADAITSHFMNALSIFIPFSERSVSEILRANLPKIKDETLTLQVRDMSQTRGSSCCNAQAIECRYSTMLQPV